MHWRTVEGLKLPALVGGHPALELCNTFAGWTGPPLPRGEWLPDADTLLVWCRYADVLALDVVADLRAEAARRPAKARRTLEHVRRLRGDVYAVLTGGPTGGLTEGHEAAFGRVAELAQRSARSSRLVAKADGCGARWELPTELGLDLPLLRLAATAAELLVSDERVLVRACPGDGCGWLFLDRRGTRRWCSMQACGNRAKTQAFAERRRRAPN